jgi:hypothetical protein
MSAPNTTELKEFAQLAQAAYGFFNPTVFFGANESALKDLSRFTSTWTKRLS